MDSTYIIRPLGPGEEQAAVDLVLRVFMAFVAPLFSVRGILEFRTYAQAAAMRQRLAQGHFALVAVAGNAPVGVIELREPNHVAALFVDGAWQRRGIARELLRHATGICRGRAPGLQELTVNAAPNAVEAYTSLGFAATGPERCVNGIRFLPMRQALG